MSAFADGGEEFAVLQFDAVHGNGDFAHVYRFFFAVHQIVVTGDVGAVVADIAEEGTERAVVIEGQRQGADGAVFGLQLDGHIHGDAQYRVNRALDGVGFHHFAAGLVLEQINGMRGVVPQQMVGPRTRFTLGVGVGAAEEIGLNVHLLDIQFTRGDFVVYPLVAGIEAAGVADHGDEAGFFLHFQHFFGICPRVGQRNFHLYVFAGAQALQGLRGVHLGGGTQDHGIQFGKGQGGSQIIGNETDAVFVGNGLGFGHVATDQGDDFYIRDVFDAVEVFFAESAGTGEGYFDGFHKYSCLRGKADYSAGASSIRWPTAVLEAGT